MQVVRFRLGALLATAIVSPVAAQTGPSLPVVELSGSYSVNSDFIANRNVVVVVDQKVSPFFSHGSGPRGFEVTVHRASGSPFARPRGCSTEPSDPSSPFATIAAWRSSRT